MTELSSTGGAAGRRRRVDKGLPRYTERELISRRAADERRARIRAAENRAYSNKVKMESGCTDCGYREHPEALDFDHLPGTVKLHNISKLGKSRRHSLAVLVAEIAKCEVVCANCHRIRTAARRAAQPH